MKKLLIILFVLIMGALVLSQTTVSKVRHANNKINTFTQENTLLLEYHELGIAKEITLLNGDTFTLSAAASPAQKAQWRTIARANCDSIIAWATIEKNLIPE